MEDFIDYYENHHSKMVKHFPRSVRYFRKYLTPRNSAFATATEAVFDVIMELWFESAEDYQADIGKLKDPDLAREFMQDEEKLFDRPRTRSFTYEEYETDLKQTPGE